MIPLLAPTQLLLLLAYAAQDVATRRLPNPPILALFAAGTLTALLDGPQWDPRNLLLPIVAVSAYRFRQIGGADAKTLMALLPMDGAWVPWFLVAATLYAATLHATTRRPPLIAAYAAAYATLTIHVLLGGRFP